MLDVAGRRGGEVSADNENVLVDIAGQERLSSLSPLDLIGVGGTAPVCVCNLYRVVDAIPRDERFILATLDVYAYVTGSMSRRGLKENLATDLVVFVNEVDKTGINHGANRVRQNGAVIDNIFVGIPIGPLFFGE
jgi:hypothetical protein